MRNNDRNTAYNGDDSLTNLYFWRNVKMMTWLKNYYTRKDTRIGFWKEDLKLNLIGVGIVLAFCGGCKLILDWKDRIETKKRIEDSAYINEKLKAYCEREVLD